MLCLLQVLITIAAQRFPLYQVRVENITTWFWFEGEMDTIH